MEQSASGKLWLPATTAQSRKPFAVNMKLDLDVECDRGGRVPVRKEQSGGPSHFNHPVSQTPPRATMGAGHFPSFLP